MSAQSNNEFALETEQLGMQFSAITVLDNVNFTLAKQEIHALAGANGAGKSTLMKILNGVYKPTSGQLRVNGAPVRFNSPLDARKQGIAMVYQDLSLVPSLSVAQNIFLADPLQHSSSALINIKKTKSEAALLLEQIGAEASIDPAQAVEDLSSGEQQIVEIAKALSQSPRILILDEPTASLSVKEIEAFLEIIRGLKNRGISIVYITHYLHDVFKIADRVTVLRDGKRVSTEKTQDTDMPTLIKNMIGEERVQSEWKKRASIKEGEVPLLELRNIQSRRIADSSLKAHAGEVVGIAGLLGSGRTELLDAIVGIDRITAGEVRIQGEAQSIANSTQSVARGISLVPENRRKRGLVLDFAIRENIVLSIFDRLRERVLLNIRKIAGHVAEKIQSLSIKTQSESQTVRFLSGGNQQKVVVAKCLSTTSKILLLDDPTFGVDVRSKQEIMVIIRDYVAEGNAAIFISSEFKEIAEFCDSVYIMQKGRITKHLTGELSEKELLLEVQ